MSHYTITQLSQEFSVTTRTIRFYESEGLLSPERQGQARIYSNRDRVRLKLILRGKRLGFSLKEIRGMLDIYDFERDEVKQLSVMIDKIRARRTLLIQQRQDIDILLGELGVVEKECVDMLQQQTSSREANE